MRARLFLLALLLFVAPSLSCGGCGSDADDPDRDQSELDPEDRTPELRELLLDEPPGEGTQPDLFSGPSPTVRDVVARIDAVRKDDWAKGLYLRLGPMGGAWGRVSDLADALAALRRARKPIHCHFDLADNASYALLAQSCDRISVTPAGDLDLVGLSAHVFYAKNLLEHLGIQAELLQVGRFKGAADTFTREDMPPETRESLGLLLDDLQASLIRAVSDGRHLSRDRVRALLDAGPYDAHGALTARLVDDVAFDDEAREHARRAAHAERVREVQLEPEREPIGLGAILRALSGDAPEEPLEGDRLALVYLEGTIADGEDEGLGGVQSGPFVTEMRELARAEDVKAVVLRIDSPGGSALASDRMWHAVRSVARRKPVIVSIGDMAASGGYYVACAGTEILAHDTSMVGSIGVVGGKIDASDLAERIGVNAVVLERSRHAAWTSPMRPLGAEERTILSRMLHTTYSRFLRRVSEGRNRPVAELTPAAEGRLMSGRRARQLGLVDRAGSLRQALARARERGRLRHDAPVEVWPPQRTMLDALAEAMGGGPPRRRRSEALIRDLAEAAGPIGRAALATPLLLGRERTAVALPYVIEIR